MKSLATNADKGYFCDFNYLCSAKDFLKKKKKGKDSDLKNASSLQPHHPERT